MNAEWLSALTALAAVLIGPFISVYITKRQIEMSVVSSSKVEWTKELRDLVGELVAEYRFVDFNSIPGNIPKVDTNTLKKLYHIEVQINLMLDPTNIEHQELSRIIENAVTYAGEFNQNKLLKITENVKAIQKTATMVIKSEWLLICGKKCPTHHSSGTG